MFMMMMMMMMMMMFRSMAMDRICEVMSVEFSILIVEVMHINGSLGNINIQL